MTFGPATMEGVRAPRIFVAATAVAALTACQAAPTPSAQPSPAVAASAAANAVPSPTWEPKPPVVPERGTFVAVPTGKFLRLWNDPGPGATGAGWFRTRNDWKQTVPLIVEGGFRDREGGEWLRVQLPVRPNGSTGWIDAADVGLEERTQRIVVDLSARKLWHFVDGEVRHTFSVGVGTSTYPTTPGRFSVWAFVEYADPSGPYGTFALGLSGFSDVITDWPGGGRMAIHGTPDVGDRGAAVSHGCVRVFNADLEALRDVPLGTPVVIRA
jgi:lipoprotein-anchoring transpeptidase ErfK/SrfK